MFKKVMLFIPLLVGLAQICNADKEFDSLLDSCPMNVNVTKARLIQVERLLREKLHKAFKSLRKTILINLEQQKVFDDGGMGLNEFTMQSFKEFQELEIMIKKYKKFLDQHGAIIGKKSVSYSDREYLWNMIAIDIFHVFDEISKDTAQNSKTCQVVLVSSSDKK